MKVLRTRRLAGLAGCAALVFGVAGTAGTVPAQAQARGTAAVAPPPDVASWGGGPLGDKLFNSRSLYADIGAGNNVVQVAAGIGGPGTAAKNTAWKRGPTGPCGPGGSTERASWATAP
jgi:hypothetical protein